MDRDVQRIEFELEEDSWSALAMIRLSSVMGDTVLVRPQRFAPRWDVCGRDDLKKVLVGNERFIGELEGIVQWLGNVREVGAKRKLCYNV